MCRIVCLVVLLCVFALADLLPASPVASSASQGDAAVSQNPHPTLSTDSLIATMPLTPSDPYEADEQILPAHFQDMVVRYSRLKALSEDESQPKNVRDFARAAQFYYKEAWDSAFAAYDVLRGRDTVLDGAVILRMATAKFKLGDFKIGRAHV